jgi:hypothetical protein
MEIDGHERILHKACAKYASEEIEKEKATVRVGNHRSPFGIGA